MAFASHTVLIDDERVVVNRFEFGPGDVACLPIGLAAVKSNGVSAVGASSPVGISVASTGV